MAEKPTISTPNLDIDKNPGQMMSPKVPKMPKIPNPTNTNQVGASPDSKKDPTKQAEQLKNKDDKKVAMKEVVSLNKNGQWSLEKKEQMYHIHQDGERITSEPVPHSHVVNKYGSVQRLEGAGYRLHPVEEVKKGEFDNVEDAALHYRPDVAAKQEQKKKSKQDKSGIMANFHIGKRNAADTPKDALHHHREAEKHTHEHNKQLGHAIDSKEYKKAHKPLSDKQVIGNWEKNKLNKNNDQWQLEKKKPEFNPRKEQESGAGELRDQWVNWGSLESRNKIPKMEGAARTRSISKLAGTTEYRRNPHTNQVEFLMHRGVSGQELGNSHNSEKGHTSYSKQEKNGWTPHKHVAHDFGVYGHDDGKPGHVVSAWVPEDQLHSSMRQYGSDDKDTQKMLSQEDEWLVDHHTPLQHHEVKQADKGMIKPLNKSDNLEKGIGNKIAAGAMAGTMAMGALGSTQAKAEMVPHGKLSQAYTTHAMDHDDAKGALSDIHDNKLVPIVHHDKDTGNMKLSLHDHDSKKEIMTFSDNADGGYNMNTQKIGKDRFSTIKQHAQSIHDHFLKFVGHVNSGGKAKK